MERTVVRCCNSEMDLDPLLSELGATFTLLESLHYHFIYPHLRTLKTLELNRSVRKKDINFNVHLLL